MGLHFSSHVVQGYVLPKGDGDVALFLEEMEGIEGIDYFRSENNLEQVLVYIESSTVDLIFDGSLERDIVVFSTLEDKSSSLSADSLGKLISLIEGHIGDSVDFIPWKWMAYAQQS